MGHEQAIQEALGGGGILASLAESWLDRRMPEVLEAAGEASVQVIVAELSTPYPPASYAGEFPHRRSGWLRENIGFVIFLADNTVRIISDAAYTIFLEFGTRKMEARPFLTPAMLKSDHLLPALEKLAA